jgi:OOP family OmpA-OmpF porin
MAAAGDRAARPRDEDATSGRNDRDPDAEIASLRRILWGREQQRLAVLQARLEDPVARAEDIGAVLPQVLVQHAHDPNLARALTPPLEKAITASVKRNPKPLADALFPVMGPAIRKAVSASLASMLESLNRTLEHSVSLRSIRWRFEAKRCGKSFAEIVLLKTLLFRVEQVFLIHRDTGILLHHVHGGADGLQDADMISGMLTAIRDFVRDSFRVAETEALESLKVGDLSVWIEAGPHAVLATVIRGAAPANMRRSLETAIETVHLEFAHELESFEGDTSAFAESRATLEAGLQAEYRAEERRPRTRWTWILAAAAVIAIAVWLGFSYRARAREARYVEALRAEPGYIVVSTGRQSGKFVVSGLRDPRAREPEVLLAGTGLTAAGVDGRWAPYYALDPPLVLARAQDVLKPPAGATLAFSQGVLSVTGETPLEWIADARRLAPLLGGVVSFDPSGAFEAAGRASIARLESEPLLFVKGAARLLAGQDAALERLVAEARHLDAIAGAAGTRYQLEVVGHTDADGPDDANLTLSLARADVLREALGRVNLTHLDIATTGVGSGQPAAESPDEPGKQKNRRVAIRGVRSATK